MLKGYICALYKGKAKGGTVYVDGSRDAQVLTLKKDDDLPKQVDIQNFVSTLKKEVVKEKR